MQRIGSYLGRRMVYLEEWGAESRHPPGRGVPEELEALSETKSAATSSRRRTET